ncbi:thermonuclease family protein [Sphingomonas sp. 2SG]|uniref:thermonuclease family protein n=1 Tax=Sphingomonas sp. 2SG TaxID=2502201 RepID=UPI001BB11E4B|nr:thermonuclease family protein [Sphingomonas sp. 2SG]
MTWLAALAALASIVGSARAIDGDTLRIGATRIRLYGIDAPELHQLCGRGSRRNPCGRTAADALGRAVEGRTVTCMPMDVDRYGRTVAVCRSAGRDVGEELVSRGLAVAYRRYSTRYVGTEDVAHTKRLGMWSDVFQPPAEFRALRRGDGARPGEAVSAPNPSCTIKGNVSSKGARIYHVPGGRDYAKVRIAPPKSERWFCSEAEAEAAGWRPAR